MTLDRVAPTVTINQQGAQSDPTNALPILFDVAFSEGVTGFAAADVAQSGTATGVTFTVTAVDASHYTVRATVVTGDGTVQPTIAADRCNDLAGNPNVASTSTDNTVALDRVAPTAGPIAPTTASPTNAGTVSFTVAFSKAVVNFNAEADLVIAETDTVAHAGVAIGGGPAAYTVDITGVSGDGGLSMAVSTTSDVQDLAANPLDSSVTSAAVVIDNTAPEILIGTPFPLESTGEDVVYMVDYVDADAETLADFHIALNATGTATGMAVVSGTGNLARTVTIINIDGEGTISFTIIPGTATDLAGTVAEAAGSSTAFTVVEELPVPLTAWPAALALGVLGPAAMRRRRR